MVTEQRMAFPTGLAKAARALGEGDEVFVYTTRGCFLVSVALFHPRRSRRKEARKILDCRLLIPRAL
ncbi:hypothetical protein [Streptomyces lydicus]|uniref:hypothetical protein n=1 Tax=Streptomyces lydicus TaxID=47763 RepID=UPI0036EC52F4